MRSDIKKLELEGEQYDIDQLSEVAKPIFKSLRFATQRVNEIKSNLCVLRRAKMSYVQSIEKEILSNKAGLLLDDN